MFDSVVWWAALEIQRARELEWERNHRRIGYGAGAFRLRRRLLRLVRRARRAGFSPAEIEGIVRQALRA